MFLIPVVALPAAEERRRCQYGEQLQRSDDHLCYRLHGGPAVLVHDGDDGYPEALGDGLDGGNGLRVASQPPHVVDDGERHAVLRGEVGDPAVQPVERHALGVVDVDRRIRQAGHLLVEHGPLLVGEQAARYLRPVDARYDADHGADDLRLLCAEREEGCRPALVDGGQLDDIEHQRGVVGHRRLAVDDHEASFPVAGCLGVLPACMPGHLHCYDLCRRLLRAVL